VDDADSWVGNVITRPNPRLQRTRLRSPLSRKPFGGMKQQAGWAALLSGAVTLSGCALGLPGYNQPFQEKVVVITPSPEAVQVRIEGSQQESIRVPADGRTIVQIPVVSRECSTYLFGLRIKDRSVEARKLIAFVRDGRVVKKISVNSLRRLPVDPAGYHELKLK